MREHSRSNTQDADAINERRFNQLDDLNQNIDWDELVDTIFPYYVKSNTQTMPLTVEGMLRTYILVRHFKLTPSQIVKALSQKQVLRDFVLMDDTRDDIPSADSITEFSSVLFEESLMKKIETALNSHTMNQ